MSEGELIECRPTKWFYLRAGAMTLMFAVFLGLFLKDWKVGYPKKNEVYYTFQAFKAAKEAFKNLPEESRKAEVWNKWAAEQQIEFPEEPGLLPSRVEREAGWPSMLTDFDAYGKAYEEEANKSTPPMWARYTDERGWSSKIPDKEYDQKKIRAQLYWGIGSGVLMLAGLFFLVRTSRRSMKADGKAFHAPDGTRIPYGEMKSIDKRKWETKGLATITYEAGGVKRKAKVDGMVYGQFKKEDGAPAEALFKRILENFKGDILELVEEDEEEDGEAEGKAESDDSGQREKPEDESAPEGAEGESAKDSKD